ncbi:MAG: cob(I)yrinic acid a,c-diamide adenosyltransferase [Oscillospiraceae bacterium]|nr:cob(I)yrinic acid a,c-diamide adenosyltransferase [Oscillospiraceae bacterium]
MKALTHLYYGDGKGKTTASIGLAVRASGQGMRVIFAQFFKTMPTGETSMLEKLGISVLRAELPKGFTWSMTEEELGLLRKEHDALLKKAFSCMIPGERTLLVLDEAIDAFAHGYLDKTAALALITGRPEEAELVLTGHSAPEELIALADYITEMKSYRHPYEQGISARRGIEF